MTASPPGSSPVDDVLQIVVQHGRIPNSEALTPTTNLYEAGLSSLTTVHLLLAIEDHFDVEFPERLLARRTFESVQSIAEAVEELLGDAG